MSLLGDRMLELRSKADYVLDEDKPVIIMIDGRSFSKLIKNSYKLPFDKDFIEIMNKVACETCKEIQGCKGAYVQSDEISFFLDTRQKPGEEKRSSPYFGYRLCKMQSIIASYASDVFNNLVILEYVEKNGYDAFPEYLRKRDYIQFDCKAWNVENNNDVFAWFLYRQLDCIRNSKQQAAQTYFSHNRLMGLDTDLQIKLLKDEEGIDWNDYNPGEKFGRFIWKEYEDYFNKDLNITYKRSVWKSHSGWELSKSEDKDKFLKQYEIYE